MNEASIYRQELRDNMAAIVVEDCRMAGAFVKYEDRAYSTPLWVWCAPNAEERALSEQGALSEERTKRDFQIPRQFSCSCGDPDCDCEGKICIWDHELFPTHGEPSSNAILYHDGKAYAVESFDRDAVGASFILHTIHYYARRTVIR